MRNRLLAALERALEFAKPERHPRLKSLHEVQSTRYSENEPQYSLTELREIARKFGVRPAPSQPDERTAIVQGLWAAGVTRLLGICQRESDALDTQRGVPKITTLQQMALTTQLGLVKRGLR